MAKSAVRLQVVQVGVFAAMALLAVRAAQVQLLEGRRWAEAAQAQRTERIVLQARRGTLSDRHGTPLALTQETYHVGVAPNELRDPARDGALIARQLGLAARAWQEALRRRYAYFAGPFSALEVRPLRSIRGVHLEAVVNRFYPAPELARATIGRVGDDGYGASGMEKTLDSLLAGRSGSAVVLKDRAGREYESPARVIAQPVAGYDVELTLDAELREIAQRALDDSRAVPDAAGFRFRHAHGDRISRGGGGEVAAAVRVDPPERREPRHWLRAVGDTDPDGGRVRRAGERRVAAAADAHSRSAQPGGPAAVPPRAGAGAPRGVARDRDGAARPAARGGGARHRCRGGTHQLSGGRENRDGASRGEWSLRGGAVHGVVRGLVPGGQAAAGARREDRQSAQGEPFRGANRRARHALHARTGPGGAHRCARPGAAPDRRPAHGSGAARGRPRRRSVRRPLAVSAGFGGRGAASDGARCDGPPAARSGPGAAPARLDRKST